MKRPIKLILSIYVLALVGCKESGDKIDVSKENVRTQRVSVRNIDANSDIQSQQLAEQFSDDSLIEKAHDIISNSVILPETKGSNELEGLLLEMLRRGDDRFYSLLESLPPGESSNLLVSQIMRKFPFGSFDHLLTVGGRIEDPAFRKVALNSSISGLIGRINSKSTDLPISRENLNALDAEGVNRSNILELACLALTQGNFRLDELSLFVDLNNSEEVGVVTKRLNDEDIKALVSSRLEGGEKIDDLSLKVLASSLSTSKPQDSLAWASGLGSTAGNVIAKAVFSNWMRYDPMRASNFLLSMDRGITRDECINVLINDCVRNNSADQAVAWLVEIEDLTIRERATKMVNDSINKN